MFSMVSYGSGNQTVALQHQNIGHYFTHSYSYLKMYFNYQFIIKFMHCYSCSTYVSVSKGI